MLRDSPFLASSSRARFLAASASNACASRASFRFSRMKSACSLRNSLILLLYRRTVSELQETKGAHAKTYPETRFRFRGSRTKWLVAIIPTAGRRVKPAKSRTSKEEAMMMGRLIRCPNRLKLQGREKRSRSEDGVDKPRRARNTRTAA